VEDHGREIGSAATPEEKAAAKRAASSSTDKPGVIRMVPKSGPKPESAAGQESLETFLRDMLRRIEDGSLNPQSFILHYLTKEGMHVHYRYGLTQLEHLGLLQFAHCGVIAEE